MPRPRSENKHVSYRLPPDLIEQIRELATRQFWTESEVARALLAMGIQAWEERGPPSRAAARLAE